MVAWQQFERESPAMARFGADRIALRVMYLGTVREDGCPRVHPVTAFLGGGGLFVFMEPTSPKARDLQRHGAYAMHSLVVDSNGSTGEFAFSGRARQVSDAAVRAMAAQACPFKPQDRYILFELLLDRALTNEYVDGNPRPNRWRYAGGGAS